jgi:hypothetical protein
MAGEPWRDALRRSTLGSAVPGTSPGTAATAGSAAAPPSGATAPASARNADPAQLSPRIAALQQERDALQARLAALTTNDALSGDPRYAVPPMAARREDYLRWAGARDARRTSGRDATEDRPRPRAEAAPPGDARAEPAPALRPTPGEAEPAGSVPTDPLAWMRNRDQAMVRARARDAAAAPRTVEAARDTLRDGARTTVDDIGRALPAFDRVDATRRMRERADDTLREVARPVSKAMDALQRPKRAIAEDWAERARKRVPALGKDDGYDKRAQRLLGVDVGSLEDIAAQSDKLRDQARQMREIADLATEKDEARRERAINRLRERKQQERG